MVFRATGEFYLLLRNLAVLIARHLTENISCMHYFLLASIAAALCRDIVARRILHSRLVLAALDSAFFHGVHVLALLACARDEPVGEFA